MPKKIAPFEPALMCMGLIHAPIDVVRDAVQSQLEKTIGKEAFNSSLEKIIWRDFFERDGHLYDGMRFKIGLFSSNRNVTIYVCNLADGWMSLYGNLIKACAFDACFFRATLSAAAEYKVFEMALWQHGKLNRHVRAFQDDNGWKFLSKGDVMSFEHLAQYKNRRVSARLDRKTIERYSEEIGYRIDSITNFDGDSWQFSRTAPSHK